MGEGGGRSAGRQARLRRISPWVYRRRFWKVNIFSRISKILNSTLIFLILQHTPYFCTLFSNFADLRTLLQISALLFRRISRKIADFCRFSS